MHTAPLPQPVPTPIALGRIIGHSLFGVLLPIITLGFEIATGMSDEIYINPIPNLLYALLVASVPAVVALNLFRCTRQQPIRRWELQLNSLAIAIAMVYTIIYLPIAPFAAVGVIAYGLGLLPLAPAFSLFSAYRLRREMKQRMVPDIPLRLRDFYVWFSAGLALLALASAPRVLTDYGIAQYMRSTNGDDSSAIKLLRTFGSEKALLKACYRRTDPIFFWGGGSRLETAEARKLYYRVTGESFNTQRKEQDGFFNVRGGSSFDRDLGGEHVGQRVEEITLEESRLDGILQPETGTGYVEWTLVFRNDDSWRDHEARMLLSMPTGGVASRVTLWVNGEPREAAFGSKAKVRTAYQNVAVRQRRDPVLVNWAGNDLLLVQCFPIQPNGGRMKIRIGMSFPLEVDPDSTLAHRYPTIVAENFTIPDSLRHAVWFEEKYGHEIHSAPVVDLTMDALASKRHSLRQHTDQLWPTFNSTHPTRDTPATFRAILPSETPIAKPHAIVVDGSRGMRPQVDSISKWLMQQDGTLDVFFASDQVLTYTGSGNECAKWLQSKKFTGGQDNVPALVAALRKLQTTSSADSPTQLYWFSGAQPIQLSGTESIRQLFERRALHIDIVACLSSRDYNALYELAPLSYCDSLYLQRDGTLHKPILHFESVASSDAAPRGSSHAHRLSLAEQTRTRAQETYNQQARLGPAKFRTQIAKIADQAAKAYLVTQLSGAVVLETDQQYKDNKLEAGDPNHVPTVPEFKHYALFLGLGSLAWIACQRRRSLGPHQKNYLSKD